MKKGFASLIAAIDQQETPMTPVHMLRAAALLAFLYVLTGKLAIMLALPPGYATAIFPPAGIAVAAVMMGGPRLLPGVFAGAFVLNLLHGFDWHADARVSALLAAVAIASGSTLQAWYGSKLLKRWLHPGLDSGRDILLFPPLAALMCLIGSSIAIGSLLLLGIVPAQDLLGNWATWWVGDTIGVMLAAPLTWIFIGQPRPLWWSRRWILSLPLIVSSAVFIIMYVNVSVWEHEQQIQTFQLKSQQVGDMLQFQFHEHEQLLFTMAGLFGEKQLVSASEFKNLVRSHLENHPELLAVAWAPKVVDAGREKYVRWARATLAPDFSIHQYMNGAPPVAADKRVQYYPITLLEPKAGNEAALGFDMLSEPSNVLTFKRALETGRPVASEPISLPIQGGRKQSLLLNQATHFAGYADSGQTEGMLTVAVQTESYLRHALAQGNFSDFAIRLEDIDASPPHRVMLDTMLRPAHGGDYQKKLEMGGRTYLLTLAPTDAYLAHQRGWQSWTALARGLVLTGLLGAFLLLLTGQRARIEEVVTDRTRKLQEREARLNAILDNAADAILTVGRNGIVVSVNGAGGNLFGYRASVMPGLSFPTLVKMEADDSGVKLLETLSKQRQPNKKLSGMNSSGKIFPISIAVSLVEVTDETFFVCIVHDLTEQQWAQEQIYQLAHHDALTGLPNRFTLNFRLEQLLAMARRNQAAIALMFVDLDHFKKINDAQGHQVGDQLLLQAAKRLKQLLRDTDTVARLGGDEFVVILTNYAEIDDVADVARRIIAIISEPYEIADQNLHTSASVGISMFPGDGNDVDKLLRNADTAMHAAKSQGRGNYQFYSAELNAVAHERLLMENRIWQALEREEFELYLQPQVNLASGEIIGAEALIRWHQPELGMIMPDRFIAIAEESDQIIPIGEWALERSMQILADWQQGEFPHLRLAVNLSAKQCISGSLLDTVDSLQAEYGVDLTGMEMEITETAAMQDPEQTQELLHQLRSRGIMVAIDDFGTGYSSLSYLKLFAIDRIKIDRSFVKDIETDQNDALIASATIALAHALGLQVIAEGVETDMQRTFLSEQRCDEAQGYLFGRPMRLADFEKLARTGETSCMIASAAAQATSTG